MHCILFCGKYLENIISVLVPLHTTITTVFYLSLTGILWISDSISFVKNKIMFPHDDKKLTLVLLVKMKWVPNMHAYYLALNTWPATTLPQYLLVLLVRTTYTCRLAPILLSFTFLLPYPAPFFAYHLAIYRC